MANKNEKKIITLENLQTFKELLDKDIVNKIDITLNGGEAEFSASLFSKLSTDLGRSRKTGGLFRYLFLTEDTYNKIFSIFEPAGEHWTSDLTTTLQIDDLFKGTLTSLNDYGWVSFSGKTLIEGEPAKVYFEFNLDENPEVSYHDGTYRFTLWKAQMLSPAYVSDLNDKPEYSGLTQDDADREFSNRPYIGTINISNWYWNAEELSNINYDWWYEGDDLILRIWYDGDVEEKQFKVNLDWSFSEKYDLGQESTITFYGSQFGGNELNLNIQICDASLYFNYDGIVDDSNLLSNIYQQDAVLSWSLNPQLSFTADTNIHDHTGIMFFYRNDCEIESSVNSDDDTLTDYIVKFDETSTDDTAPYFYVASYSTALSIDNSYTYMFDYAILANYLEGEALNQDKHIVIGQKSRPDMDFYFGSSSENYQSSAYTDIPIGTNHISVGNNGKWNFTVEFVKLPDDAEPFELAGDFATDYAAGDYYKVKFTDVSGPVRLYVTPFYRPFELRNGSSNNIQIVSSKDFVAKNNGPQAIITCSGGGVLSVSRNNNTYTTKYYNTKFGYTRSGSASGYYKIHSGGIYDSTADLTFVAAIAWDGEGSAPTEITADNYTYFDHYELTVSHPGCRDQRSEIWTLNWTTAVNTEE